MKFLLHVYGYITLRCFFMYFTFIMYDYRSGFTVSTMALLTSLSLTIGFVVLCYVILKLCQLRNWLSRLSVINRFPGEKIHWLFGTVHKVKSIK